MSKRLNRSSAVRVTYADGRTETKAADAFRPKRAKRSRQGPDGADDFLPLLRRLKMAHYGAAKRRQRGQDDTELMLQAADLERRIDRVVGL